jgi:hypothetical protein
MDLLVEKVIKEVYPKILEIKEFDYLNIQCGYYERILQPEYLENLRTELEKGDFPLFNDSANEIEDKDLFSLIGCMFYIGYDTHVISTDDETKELMNHLLIILKNDNHEISGIYFKNVNKREKMHVGYAMQMVELLTKMYHCGCFALTTLYCMKYTKLMINGEEKTLLTLSYDTESG